MLATPGLARPPVRALFSTALPLVFIAGIAAFGGTADGAEAARAPATSSAAQAAAQAILPPPIPWTGKSRALALRKDDPWVTPCEASGLARTPRYDETVAWLRRLADASPDLEMVSLGKSAEGRDVWMLVAAAGDSASIARITDGHGHGPDLFSPEGLRASRKPTVLAQAGIHAGEIDGKDAGMMFLRDLTVRGTKRALLNDANFLFVPIFNVDGHERFSAFTRINQRGPEEAGWRTTARNLNLNRDYAKIDTPELRAMVAAINAWTPDLYVDLHVTDGSDYQYDVTWGYNGAYGYSPAIAGWLAERLTPAATRDLSAMGHVPGPLIFQVDNRDAMKGCAEGVTPPRLSTGYGDARHLASVLVENHSLKSYDRRVLGMYVLLESMLRTVAADAEGLRAATAADRARRADPVTLAWKVPEGKSPDLRTFLGIESRLVPSAISGSLRVEYTGKPITAYVPWHVESEPATTVSRPIAYWIPPVWTEVIERLALHGVAFERIADERTLDAEVYRIDDAKVDATAFEGRAQVAGTPVLEKRRVTFAPGSVRVATDQPLGDLAVVLLEPRSDDSFFHWGFFLETTQRTEYAESYVLEPMAERMLAADPELRAAFEKKLMNDAKFAGNADERLNYFYQRTPFYDDRWSIYPVAREVSATR